MRSYRRIRLEAGMYFSTHALRRRQGSRLLVEQVDALRAAVASVGRLHSFAIHAWVVLPEHFHCIIELPPGDADNAMRWRLIKSAFSRSIVATAPETSRLRSGERGIWQRRFWEHLIVDARDYEAHVDYIHFNPVKHGWAKRVADWPYSTFSRFVARGIYPDDWAGTDSDSMSVDPFDP